MVDENENEQKKEEEKSDVDLAKEILELKKNTVSKADYEKLKEENNDLKTLMLNNNPPPDEKLIKEKKDLKKLKEKWQNPNQNNLEYCTNMLKYREALIESGENDPFLPFGKEHGVPKADEIASAEKVAKVMQECIDACGGDSRVFTAMLNSRMVDPVLPKKKK